MWLCWVVRRKFSFLVLSGQHGLRPQCDSRLCSQRIQSKFFGPGKGIEDWRKSPWLGALSALQLPLLLLELLPLACLHCSHGPYFCYGNPPGLNIDLSIWEQGMKCTWWYRHHFNLMSFPNCFWSHSHNQMFLYPKIWTTGLGQHGLRLA